MDMRLFSSDEIHPVNFLYHKKRFELVLGTNLFADLQLTNWNILYQDSKINTFIVSFHTAYLSNFN